MSSSDSSTITIRGIVTPLPDTRQCRVALMDNDIEYAILPRGAGIDLADMVSRQLEVVGILQEEGEIKRLLVRSYKVLDELDDDAWYNDDA